MAAKIDRARLERVESLYLSAHSEREIQKLVADEFRCSRRAVRKYLKIVRDRLAEQVKGADPDATRARVEGMLLAAYRAAEIGHPERGPDPKAMVQAARALGDLHGVNAPRKVEHSGSISTNYDDVLGRIAALTAGDGGEADAGAVGAAAGAGPAGDRVGGGG
jgi:hypothetical protein